jgi:hypothetical protein
VVSTSELASGPAATAVTWSWPVPAPATMRLPPVMLKMSEIGTPSTLTASSMSDTAMVL